MCVYVIMIYERSASRGRCAVVVSQLLHERHKKRTNNNNKLK